jgi:iron complex transport system ATP-binding protein
VVLVVHDLALAARLADTIVLLRAGRVVATGDTAAMLTPETIAATYGVAVEVGHTAGGERYIVPTGRV